MGDLSNPDEYSDRSIINNLVTYGIPEFKDAVDQLLAVYWDENTICGVAADAEGNYGPVIRQMVNLTKEGASPAGELIGGGLSNIDELYPGVVRHWQEHVFSDRVNTRLVRARHGDSSGVRGAAWLGAQTDV